MKASSKPPADLAREMHERFGSRVGDTPVNAQAWLKTKGTFESEKRCWIAAEVRPRELWAVCRLNSAVTTLWLATLQIVLVGL
jgi:hypothetical protein